MEGREKSELSRFRKWKRLRPTYENKSILVGLIKA